MSTADTPFRNGMTLAEYDRALAELRGLSARLGVPVMPDLHIGVRLQDATGAVLQERTEQGHSWTRNAWNLFNSWMMDAPANAAAFSTGDTSFRRGYLGLRSIGSAINGTTADILAYRVSGYSGGGLQAALAAVTGVVLGTSTEAFSGEDFCLWGAIASGTAAGQLSYLAQATPVTTFDSASSTYTCTYTRVFNNNSASAITVNEVGLLAGTAGYLLSRDVLASPVSVPVGGQLTITVTITTTSFAALEATCAAYPVAAGASYGGGTFIGYVGGWANSSTNGGITNGHTKYALILSPKAGGELAARQYYNSGGSFTVSPNDLYYGKNNSDALVAAGALSSLGQHCSAQNTAALGGFSDWYVPSHTELTAISQRFASIPSAEQPSNANYWSSSWVTTTSAYVLNPATGGLAVSATNGSVTSRLVRRVKF